MAALSAATWLLATHLDRVHNERRLSTIATQIAGRPVKVHCPGVLARHLSYDIVEGSVRFDAQGRPGDTADLQGKPCAELDALAEGRRDDVLRCIACATPAAVDLAMAVDVLTHESFHLAGIADEAETECRALAEMARTAQRLGATRAQGAALADLERRTNYVNMPDRYHTDCAAITGA